VTGRQRATLRAWQREALAAYEREARRDFLVTATPGAGKTTFALTLAARLVDRRAVDRVIVVCPTDHLRTQWAETAGKAGITLDPNLPNSVGPLRTDVLGYVTTYAQVAAKPRLHAARTMAKRALVILDEVHHAGDGLAWGVAVAEAFADGVRRVCLTGTPFRTRPDEFIPFVRYDQAADGGRAVVAPQLPELTADDEDFLGLPGLFTPEQMATLLAQRDAVARRRASAADDADGPARNTWRAAAELRREVNRLVSVVASRSGQPHAHVHAQLRQAVPGPPSASASAEVLEQRRDHLMALVAS
jgi:Type III restriction enzyme, res subunit